MQTEIRAGIDIYRSVLRYAEVERRGPQYRLLRLGSCTFEFDLADALLRDGQPGQHETVRQALDDVFEGSSAAQLHVVLHPPDTYAFHTPVAAQVSTVERRRMLTHQVELLVGEPSEPLHITQTPLYGEQTASGERMEWFHALTLPEQAHSYLERLTDGLAARDLQLHSSMGAVARTLTRLYELDSAAPEDGLQLGIGVYPTHFEFTLCHGAYWIYSLHAPAGPSANAAYYAVKLLDHLRYHTRDVYRIALYGELGGQHSFDLLSELMDCPVRPLNTLASLDLAPDRLGDDDAQVAAYAPCIGAAS